MAWTWSAPQRGTVAASLALSSGHRMLQRSAISLGRGDAMRGTCIGFAAFLTVAGAAAPNLSTVSLTSLLFVAGAILVLYATVIPSRDATTLDIAGMDDGLSATAQPAQRQAAPACLQELLASQATSSASDRAAFARLTAHMSHELRTPLNAILGFSELMSNEVFGPLGSSCYAAYARDIHASGLNLLKSAEDALAITSLLTTPGDHHHTAIAHAATASTETLAFHAHDFANRSISSSCTVDSAADIHADPQAVRQLLINLVADAAARIEPGAHLSIASRTGADSVEILITIAGRLKAQDGNDSFSMLLARTLAELSGARLTADVPETGCSGLKNGEWQIAAHFTRAAQNDFFSASRRAA